MSFNKVTNHSYCTYCTTFQDLPIFSGFKKRSKNLKYVKVGSDEWQKVVDTAAGKFIGYE